MKQTNLHNSIHFVLQSKGGVGKTFCASLLAQHLLDIGANLKGFDTDQENPDFAAYHGLPVRHVDVMDDATTINQKKFDSFLAALVEEEGTFVVDNGANTFTPLLGYLVENHAIELLEESGKRVYLHGIIGGGDNLESTLIGFSDLANNTESPLVVWLNEFHGALVDSAVVPVTERPEFTKHADRIRGVVVLHKRNPQTFGADIARMTKERLTIAEALANPAYNIMERQRLKTFAREVFAQLDQVRYGDE